MDLIPNPSDLFHPALPDSSVNFSQHGAWHCAHHNKKIRLERGVMSKRGKRHSTLNMETEVSLSKSLHMLPIYCHCFFMFVSLDVGPTASSHKLFPILLIVGWVTACTAVVFFVYIFAWVHDFVFKAIYNMCMYVAV